MPSTAIREIDYNEDSATLKITFVSGAVYCYYHVPPGVYADLMKATSKGRFLNYSIKGIYPYKHLN